MRKSCYIFLCITNLISIVVATGVFSVTDLKNCMDNPVIGGIDSVNNKNLDGVLELNLNCTLNKAIGNDNRFVLAVDRILNNRFAKLGSIKGEGACDAINKYGGDIYVKAANAAGIKDPKKCPIPKGKLSLSAYNLVLGDIPIAKLAPKGSYRLIVTAFGLNPKDDKL